MFVPAFSGTHGISKQYVSVNVAQERMLLQLFGIPFLVFYEELNHWGYNSSISGRVQIVHLYKCSKDHAGNTDIT